MPTKKDQVVPIHSPINRVAQVMKVKPLKLEPLPEVSEEFKQVPDMENCRKLVSEDDKINKGQNKSNSQGIEPSCHESECGDHVTKSCEDLAID